jgi:hypothetical protein
MRLRIILSSIVLNCVFAIQAQVSIVSLPSQNGSFLFEEIWRVTLLSSNLTPINGDLVAEISDGSSRSILQASLKGLNLSSGSNNIDPTISRKALLIFGNDLKSNAVRNTGAFPYGQYAICYFFYESQTNKLLGEFCAEKTVDPIAPPELLQPSNREEIATVSPFLIWKPPFPIGASITYVLRLVEIKSGQSDMEAIERNTPLLNRQVKDITQIIYPSDAPNLEVDKSYAWFITAYAGDYSLGTTEVWQFKIAKTGETPLLFEDSYSMLKPNPDGTSYVTHNSYLRFAYNNRQSESKLQYSIIALNGKERIPIEGLPDIVLVDGMNKVDIDLSNNRSFEDTKPYLLEIMDGNGHPEYFEFTYNSKK